MAVVLAFFLEGGSPAFASAAGPASAEAVASVSQSASLTQRLPIAFEANRGQSDPAVRFLARGAGYALFLTEREAVLSLRGDAGRSETLRMRLVGGSRSARIVAEQRLPGVSNYFLGNDPAKWRTGVPQYGKVRYEQVYPGIDLVYYGDAGQLEYDFVVAPGAEPANIRIAYHGATSLSIADNGDLVLSLAGGQVRHHRPVVYQMIAGQPQPVHGRFVLEGDNSVSFRVPSYDRSAPLVIDPVLSYSSYLGGSGADYPRGVAVHSDGSIVVAGYTNSANFPTQGGPQGSSGGDWDGWIAKINSAGTALVSSTYLGGSAYDSIDAVTLDAAGNAYVTGMTSSANFPTAGTPFRGAIAGGTDAFVAKLSAGGSTLVFSTFLGGTFDDFGVAIAVEASGSIVVAGTTRSTDFPTSGAPFQATHRGGRDVFVARLNAAGSALLAATYLGGSADDQAFALALGASGEVVLAGQTSATDFPLAGTPVQAASRGGTDAFAARLSTSFSSLTYATYLGGSAWDMAAAVALDGAGTLFLVGLTQSPDFPVAAPFVQGTLRGARDGFIARIGPASGTLLSSTYLGGGGDDAINAVRLKAGGIAVVCGSTASPDFPVVNAPVQGTYGGGGDAFLAEVDAAGGAIVASTFLGGSGSDAARALAFDSSGGVVLVGSTDSTNFPTVAPLQGALAGGTDTFVAKLVSSSGAVPVAGFTWSPAYPDVGQVVQFTDTSTGSPTSWAWAFGDGATGTAQNPTHAYTSAGAKSVSLTVSNQAGSSTRTQTVMVGCQPITSPPTLTATLVASDRVRLAWTAVAGATSYRLRRGTQVIYTGSALAFTDAGLQASTSYCYSVQPLNACGEGTASTQQCVTTPGPLQYSRWLPVAIHAAGAAGSQWRTDVALHNSAGAAATYELRLVLTGEVVTGLGTVGASSQVMLLDVVNGLGRNATGALEIRSSQPLRVTSRTYNQSSAGTLGQNIPSYAATEGLSTGQTAYLPQLTENGAYRTNISLTNMGSGVATARVELFAGSGNKVGEYTTNLNPGEWKQENRPFATKAAQSNLAAGYAKVTVTAGSGVVAVASVVDNVTNDPTTQVMATPTPGAGWLWLPVASHAAGALGSQWRTDLGILNTRAQAAAYSYAVHIGGQSPSASGSAAAGSQAILVDVVGQLGMTGSGALGVNAAEGMIVTSRTYNQSASGTFGQNLGAYSVSQGLRAGQEAYLLALAENAAYRTNIALTNTSTAAASAVVELYDSSGTKLAEYSVTLSPFEWKQENRPFATKASRSNLASGYAKVRVTTGSGVVAYASVVDNVTNDPTTITMVP